MNKDELLFVSVVGGAFFLFGFSFVLGQIYLAYFQMDRIMNALRNSSGVEFRKHLLNGGFLGVHFLLISVAYFLIFSTQAIKTGTLAKEDYLNFPSKLMKQIRFIYALAFLGCLSLFVFYVVSVYMGWY
ncbi:MULTISPECIES: hypothetical protein [unclassified Pseudomonas]|uniref:hypothetical protein n=1 Tax=unclassified Pseudomonas TaxID=196821 RepID=UPI000B8742C6|nr:MULTISPECIES: hypothetical protein [unclassified Pseudomonas]